MTALTLAGTIADGPGVALLSVAMGVMNTTLTRVGGQSVNVGFITGGLSAMATHFALAARRVPLEGALAPWDTHGRRALQLGGVWLALFFGAVVSAVVGRFAQEVTLVPAIFALLGLAAAGWGHPSIGS